MKQTKNALYMLLNAYKGINKKALYAGLAGVFVLFSSPAGANTDRVISGIVQGPLDVNYDTNVYFQNNSGVNGDVILHGNGGDESSGTAMNAKLATNVVHNQSTGSAISGNLTSQGGKVYVDSGDGDNVLGNMTLTVNGDYSQSSLAFNDDTGLSVMAYRPEYTSTLNVNGNFTTTGGWMDLGMHLGELVRRQQELDGAGRTDLASALAQGNNNSILNVGGNFTVSGSASLHVCEGGILNVSGNAVIDSEPANTTIEVLQLINVLYPEINLTSEPNIVSGTANFKQNLTLSGFGLLAYGKTAAINVGGLLYTDKANLITLKHGATFTGTKSAMLNSAGNAKNDNIAEGTFNVDATSTVKVTGIEKTDSATIKAVRQQLFSTDSGILDFAGATILDAPKGDQVGFSEVKKFEGTTALSEKMVTGVSGEVTGSNSWGSAVLAAGSQTMTITSGGVSLNKPKDGKFVATSDGGLGSVNLAEGAQLSLNANGSLGNISGSGTVKVGNNAGGSVNANSVAVKTLYVEHGSSLNVASTLSLEEGSLDGGSTLKASTVTLNGTGNTFSILGGSSLTANMLVLNGNTIFADPVWSEKASVVYSSSFGADAGSSTLDGDIVIGQNSGLYTGTALSESLFGGYLASTMSAAGITALAYVDKAFTVGSGSSLTVDGSLLYDSAAKADNTVVIAKNSTLVVTNNALANGAAITFAAAGSVTNDGSVLLKDVDVANGSTYTVFSNATLAGSGKYNIANALFTGSADSTGVVTASYCADNAAKYLSETDGSIASAVKTYAENGGTFKALSFLNQALSLGSTSADAVRSKAIGQSFNSAARFSVLAGGIQNAEMASMAAYNAIEERLGFGSATVSRLAAIDGTHASIWAQPLYGYQKSKGFDGSKSGDYGVKSKLYGVTLGSDVSFGNFVVGGSFSIGKGDSKSRGDYAYTKNDYDFFGIAAYGSYAINNFLLMADVGFTKVSGDVDQYNAAGTLKGDVDTKVFTLGFKGKYTFKLSALDIAPHAGIRYSYYDIGSDNIRYGKEQLKNKSLDAKVLYLPVGVAFSKDVKVDNWSIKSVCDLELIAATGDTDVTSKVVASGVELSAKSDVVDKFSYSGKLGVNFEKGNFGLGLGYRYLGSKNVNNHNVYLNARYNF